MATPPSSIVRIIACGPLYFFTTPLPPGAVSPLMPVSEDASTDLISAGNVPYFVVMVSVDEVYNEERKRQRTLELLQQTWSELVKRGAVIGDMPMPVDGNPRHMLLPSCV